MVSAPCCRVASSRSLGRVGRILRVTFLRLSFPLLFLALLYTFHPGSFRSEAQHFLFFVRYGDVPLLQLRCHWLFALVHSTHLLRNSCCALATTPTGSQHPIRLLKGWRCSLLLSRQRMLFRWLLLLTTGWVCRDSCTVPVRRTAATVSFMPVDDVTDSWKHLSHVSPFPPVSMAAIAYMSPPSHVRLQHSSSSHPKF